MSEGKPTMRNPQYPTIDPAHGTSTPRAAQGTQAALHALRRAQHFVCLVRDESADGIGAYLDTLTQDAMYGLVTTLAAMVPDDQSANDLLAWIDQTPLEVVA